MASYIGTYGEKSLHRDLKWRLEPSGAFHEAPVGKYIVDIKTETGITEIQTQSFYKLRQKLSALLADNIVTLVYPLAREKLILWTDRDSGEIISARRSPRRGSFYAAFRELYQIKTLLTSENLIIRIMLVDVSERRYTGDRRKRYYKADTDIRSLCGELIIAGAGDYLRLIPAELEERFTSRDYSGATGLNMRNAGVALNVLHHVGAVERAGKSGRYYLYARRG